MTCLRLLDTPVDMATAIVVISLFPGGFGTPPRSPTTGDPAMVLVRYGIPVSNEKDNRDLHIAPYFGFFRFSLLFRLDLCINSQYLFNRQI